MSRTVKKLPSGGKIVITEDMNLEDLLSQLDITVRGRKTRLAVKRATAVVNRKYRQTVPVGKTGNLKASIPTAGKTPVREYVGLRGVTYVGIAGAMYPKGSHAHLIEDGHEVKVSRGPRKGQAPLSGSPFVQGKRVLLNAAQSTRKKQIAVLTKTILDAIKEEGG